MVSMDRSEDSISFTLHSKLLHIHEVICEAEEFLRGCGVNDTTRISIVLRELLSNAIWHGNRNVASRRVHCRIDRVGERQFKIAVEDEGEGFDFSGLDVSLPDDPRHIKNRGYVLIHSICSLLEFNERGNRVTAYIDDFEQVLLQYAETLYAVALNMTRDPKEAKTITQSTLMQAWDWRTRPENAKPLKMELLTLLRQTFLGQRRSPGQRPVRGHAKSCSLIVPTGMPRVEFSFRRRGAARGCSRA